MQKLKKYLAVFMTVLMIGTASLANIITASAADFKDVNPDDRYMQQIDMLSDIGVIKGTSTDEFSPEMNVTREQMALLLYRLMMGKDNAGRENTTPFTDLYEPAYSGAISWAYANGYILGTSETTFEPKGGITLQDAIAMVTRALGQTNDKTNAGYPWSYIGIGNRLGLTDELDGVEYTQTLTRAETAALLMNGITADYVMTKNAGGTTVTVTSTILSEVYGYEAGTATIVATNDFALPSFDTVVKNDYALVLITDNDGKSDTAFVRECDLGYCDDVNNHLGEELQVFYRVNRTSGIASLLGQAPSGEVSEVNSFTYDSGKTYVNIAGVKYQVVSDFSSSTATNANEIKVFAFDDDAILSQITSNSALASFDGYFTMKIVDAEEGKTAIIMPLNLGKLEITSAGAINIANNLKAEELKGGFVNPDNAKNGDAVLYYMNSATKSLVIAEKLTKINNVQVSRKTATTATIGGKTYTLGINGTNENAQAVSALLTVGEKYNIIVYRGSVISATDVSEEEAKYDSTYRIATSDVTTVVYKNRVCYFMTANILGKEQSIYVTNSSVVKGDLYRYEADNDGIMTLTDVASDKFAQPDEIKFVAQNSQNATISKGQNVYYTLEADTKAVNFVTDNNTIIVINTGAGIVYKTGAYASTITVNSGANVVAVLEDNAGSIETLKYMYISNGSFGNAVDTNSSVIVLEANASEYVDGKIMTSYTVYNLGTGKIETLYSEKSNLEDGKFYMLDENGHITENEAQYNSGKVTGYASGIVTIDGTTYKVTSATVISEIKRNANDNFEAVSLKLANIYEKDVCFIAEGNEIARILVIGQ